jgi:catalase
MAKKTLTTNQGVSVADNQNSLTAGQRGPVLIKDVHIIEKQDVTL